MRSCDSCRLVAAHTLGQIQTAAICSKVNPQAARPVIALKSAWDEICFLCIGSRHALESFVDAGLCDALDCLGAVRTFSRQGIPTETFSMAAQTMQQLGHVR